MSHLVIQKKQNAITGLSSSYYKSKSIKHSLKLELQNKSTELKQCIEDLKNLDEEKKEKLFDFSLNKLDYEKEFLKNKLLEKELEEIRRKESELRLKVDREHKQFQRLKTKIDIENEEKSHVVHDLEKLYSTMDRVDDEINKLQDKVHI